MICRSRRLLWPAAAAGALFVAARTLDTYLIAEDSMEPTLRDGDWVVALRRPATVRRGDVVVVSHPYRPGFDLVKRVVGVAGDTVAGRTLPPDTIWVAGDAPQAGSVDSHSLGPLPVASVRGRVIVKYHPGVPRPLWRDQPAARR